ncbi:hypothetical protein [Flavobacterium sp.]|uniref:hypothetical protein n=1 Tax=Flavobacterium sp. TaxID=239 RepID=UPI002613D012|nr:hypothetical protein [Flavobacterium sp.]
MRYEEYHNSYLKTRRKLFYIGSGLFFVFSIIFVVPDLSKDLNDYDKSVEVFKKSRIDVTERQKGFSTIKDFELIISMENGREWTFSEQYKNYWKEIGDSSNVGKTYIIYTSGYTYSNPAQVEIENKVIYSLGTLDDSKYSILVLSFICCIFSIYDYSKFRKRKKEMEI